MRGSRPEAAGQLCSFVCASMPSKTTHQREELIITLRRSTTLVTIKMTWEGKRSAAQPTHLLLCARQVVRLLNHEWHAHDGLAMPGSL